MKIKDCLACQMNQKTVKLFVNMAVGATVWEGDFYDWLKSQREYPSDESFEALDWDHMLTHAAEIDDLAIEPLALIKKKSEEVFA